MNKKALFGISILAVVGVVGAMSMSGALLGVAQKNTPAKVYHVGVLSGLDVFFPTAGGFKQKMSELGYVEGKNIEYNVQKTNFEPEKEKQILQQFITDHVDLILVFPTEVSLAAKEVTKGTTIPVLFADAFTEGVPLIESTRLPGGNITGIRFPGAEISIRRLELLHELLPQAKRIWVTYQEDYPPVPPLMEKVRDAAKKMQLTLVEVPATSGADIHNDLVARGKLPDIGIDAMLTVTEPLAIQGEPFAEIITFADTHKLMLVDTAVIPGDAGPLFGIFTDATEAGEKAATLADKIFNGIPAGTIPVASLESYLYINNKVAQKLGIPLSEGFLSQAKEIVR